MAVTSINAIEKKINDTLTEIENIKQAENPNLQGFMLNELTHRLGKLEEQKQEILNAQAKEVVELRLFGDKIDTGKISIRVLSAVLESFQKFTDAIANAIVHKPTTAGKIPDYVRQLTNFQLVKTFPGSFGVVLEKEYEQVEASSDYSQLNQILNELFRIIENNGSSNELISAITPYGKRAIASYQEWLYSIKNSNINLDIKWIDDSAKQRSYQLLSKNTDAIIDALDSIDTIDDEIVEITGTLTGLNVRNLSFEIQNDANGLIKGKSKIDTIINIGDSIGQEITAKLIKSTAKSATGFVHTSWLLQSID